VFAEDAVQGRLVAEHPRATAAQGVCHRERHGVQGGPGTEELPGAAEEVVQVVRQVPVSGVSEAGGAGGAVSVHPLMIALGSPV
jgi:hypothetical protein